MTNGVSLADVCAFLGAELPLARTNNDNLPQSCAALNFGSEALNNGIDLGRGPHQNVCPWTNCNKRFSSRWGLGRHYRIHTGVKPWVCRHEGCAKGFVDRALLARHDRTHSKARPHLCPHQKCEKAFKIQKHLEYHLQLHDKPDAFSCSASQCKKNFSNPSSLRIHRLLDHVSPELETQVERQLRLELSAVTADLADAKRGLVAAQDQLSNSLTEVRELRKQVCALPTETRAQHYFYAPGPKVRLGQFKLQAVRGEYGMMNGQRITSPCSTVRREVLSDGGNLEAPLDATMSTDRQARGQAAATHGDFMGFGSTLTYFPVT